VVDKIAETEIDRMTMKILNSAINTENVPTVNVLSRGTPKKKA